jgi:hypothetical protein
MLESVIVLIGNFILPYLVLSLLAMLLVELVAAMAQLRGLTLKRFIGRMLADPNGDGIAGNLYRHHLIDSLSPNRLPSYIPSRLFAIAFADTVRGYGEDGSFIQGIQRLPSEGLRRGMQAILRNASPGRELRAIELWYNEVMDGASGAYRLRTLFIVILVAAAMVVPVNFDAIRISNHVARRSMIEKLLEARLQSATKVDTATAKGVAPSRDMAVDTASLQALAFPIGWSGESTEVLAGKVKQPSWTLNRLLMKVVGLLTSILAITLGAPFLFDLLNRFMVVRSTVKPWEKWPESEPQSAPAVTPAP